MKKTLLKIYGSLEEILGSALLVAACLVTTLQVVSRYVLNSPFVWTEEASTFLFVWFTFLGAALALKRQEHFVLKFFVDRLPPTLAAIAEVVAGLLTVGAAGLLAWYGAQLTLNGWDVTTPVLEIPRSVPFAAVCVGGLLMVIRATENLVTQMRALAEKSGEGH